VSVRGRNALGVALSVGFLLWTFRDVRIADVLAQLARANPWLLLAAAVAGTLIFPLRARRWRTILDPVAGPLPFPVLWRATAIGMMGNNLLPARAGELARAYALSRETDRVNFPTAFASLAVDRVFDAFVVLLLMLAAMSTPSFPHQARIAGISPGSYVVSGTVVAAAVLVTLYLIVFFPDRVITVYEWLARRIAPGLEARGRDALHSFAGGLGVLRHPERFAAVFLWTLAHWLLNAFAFWLGFVAVGIPAPYSAALFLQGLIAIGVALPSAPGFFGVFEKVGQVGLRVYGVDAVSATSWAVSFHILTFIPITVIGIYYFSRLGLRVSELRAVRESGQ